jgi:transcriptional regulator with XRE-family HTH domain
MVPAMDYSLTALGQVIRDLRVSKGLTQDQLGSEAGYGAGAGVSISRIENAWKSNPTS